MPTAPLVLTPRTGEYLLLEVALPGRAPENAGVLLVDPAADRLYVKLRRDWNEIAAPEDAEVLEALEDDLALKARESGAARCLAYLEDSLSNVLRLSARVAVQLADFESRLKRLYRENVQPKVLPFRTHVPVWTLRAAAGSWGGEMAVETEDYTEILDDVRLTADMFAAHVTGRSMQPLIPDGSLCLFRRGVTGSRAGRMVLVENFGESENQGRYTVKRYTSRKAQSVESWRHEEIVLEPLNPEFEPWPLTADAIDRIKVLAEFIRVIE